ncbi:SoxS protein [Paracoccus alkanivorans]|nr:SoxS protein [Paracoccus alkanivorans]
MRAVTVKSAAAIAAVTLALGGPLSIAPTLAGEAGRIPDDRVDWQSAPLRLLMVEQEGCIYCEAWDREIGPGFAKSSEGLRAPLLRVDIDGPWPDGIALERRPTITPTFILLREGAELSRLEGYPGDQYFYPLIDEMLSKANIPAITGKAGG